MKVVAKHSHAHQRGVTLVELIITIVILGIALSTLVSALIDAINLSADPAWEHQALAIVQSYGEAIMAMPQDTLSKAVSHKRDLTCLKNKADHHSWQANHKIDINSILDEKSNLIIDGAVPTDFNLSIYITCTNELPRSLIVTGVQKITVKVESPTGLSRSISFFKGYF